MGDGEDILTSMCTGDRCKCALVFKLATQKKVAPKETYNVSQYVFITLVAGISVICLFDEKVRGQQ